MAGVKGRSGTNKGKDKPFVDALRMELLAAGEDHKALRVIAKKLIAKAEGGCLASIQELANRTDGRVAQQLIHTGDEDGGPIETITKIELVALTSDDSSADTASS
jgi:hypothetical protein